jgi:hypothetical protein
MHRPRALGIQVNRNRRAAEDIEANRSPPMAAFPDQFRPSDSGGHRTSTEATHVVRRADEYERWLARRHASRRRAQRRPAGRCRRHGPQDCVGVQAGEDPAVSACYDVAARRIEQDRVRALASKIESIQRRIPALVPASIRQGPGCPEQPAARWRSRTGQVRTHSCRVRAAEWRI